MHALREPKGISETTLDDAGVVLSREDVIHACRTGASTAYAIVAIRCRP